MSPSHIEGQPPRLPDPVSGAFQGYNDPPPDSLFEKVDGAINRCKSCGHLVYNNTESRDGHLNRGCRS